MVFRDISSCLALWNTWCVMAQAWQLPPLPLIEELIIKAGASFNAGHTTRGDQLLSKTSSITTRVQYSLEWGSRALQHQDWVINPMGHLTSPNHTITILCHMLLPRQSTPSTVVQMRPNRHQNSLAICLDMSRI